MPSHKKQSVSGLAARPIYSLWCPSVVGRSMTPLIDRAAPQRPPPIDCTQCVGGGAGHIFPTTEPRGRGAPRRMLGWSVLRDVLDWRGTSAEECPGAQQRSCQSLPARAVVVVPRVIAPILGLFPLLGRQPRPAPSGRLEPRSGSTGARPSSALGKGASPLYPSRRRRARQ